MLLREQQSGDLVEAIGEQDLINPFVERIEVQLSPGSPTAKLQWCDKANLTFPSGEPLPQCWQNGHLLGD
ncbi:hypothetical protein [Ferrimonas senticii]|uniref:hypothetical protein n=1 Tax=Ferrimonas senticii TaxID=394566 RepID=UPI0003FF5D0A|nr:hypothetical protein [Ferrimonas senticii]